MVMSDFCILKGLEPRARFNMGECRNDQGEEIGIEGVKKLITTFENSSLKKELLKITKDVEKRSTKGNFDKDGSQANILEDDLTIIGLGK